MSGSELLSHLPLSRFPQRTLTALLAASATRWSERRFLRFLDPRAGIREVTFGQLGLASLRAAKVLAAQGVGAGSRVLLLAENSPEWMAISFGAQLRRAEPAALFASLSAEPAAAIARRVRPTVVFVSSAAQWAKLVSAVPELVRCGLTAVIAGEPLPSETLPREVGVLSLEEATVAASGGASFDELGAAAAAVGEEDPFLLLFTSGTTGRPKGVRLPQRAIVRALEAGASSVGISAADVGLHFLPFGHVAGHDQFNLALAQGHQLVMTARRDDLDAALALSPTYLFSVPLVYDRIREGAMRKVGALPGPLAALVEAALAAAERMRVDGSRRWRDRGLAVVSDLLIGRAVRRRLGGAVRAVYSGGAPATIELLRFFEGLALPFIELYGMSETAGMISANPISEPRRPGAVGLISPDHEARLAPDGELQLRGPLLLSSYLDAEDDQEAWTADGFFRTGDLARADRDGYLYVEGRRRNLLVLSTGKKLSPEPVEQAIGGVPPFHAAMLLGEGRPYVAAAVFVERGELARLEASGEDAATALLPRVRAALSAFSEYEVPKRLLVVPGAPDDYPAMLTPSFKLRREAVVAWLGESIAALYGEETHLSPRMGLG